MAAHDESEEEAFSRARTSRRKTRRNTHGSGRDESGFHDPGSGTSAYFQAFLNVAKGQAAYFADRYKNETAQVVDDFAASLRHTTEKRGHGGEGGALVGDVASSLEELSAVIRDLKISAALADVERLARRQPTTLVLASVVAGFVLSRAVLGSSHSPEPEDEIEDRYSVRRRSSSRRAH